MIAALLLIIFSASMVYVIIHSLLYKTVPNIILAVLLGAFLLLYPWIEVGTSTYFYHIAAFFAFLIAGFVFYAKEHVTFGPVKLYAEPGFVKLHVNPGAIKLNSVISLYISFTFSLISFYLLIFIFALIVIFIEKYILKNKTNYTNYSVSVGLAGLIVYPGTYLGKMGVDYLSALIGVS